MSGKVHLATPHGLAVCGHRMKTGHRKKLEFVVLVHRKKLEFVVLKDKDSITCVSCKRVANIKEGRPQLSEKVRTA